jgi:DNA adenine methylase
VFRWAGGKRWLVSTLAPLARPSAGRRYFEPFFGGGALFFAVRPAGAVISDKNDDLMACYRAVRDNPRAVERALRGFTPDEDGYYRARKAAPASASGKAARLIFLATHSFNGIYRVNLDGVFNVPYGHRAYALGAKASLEQHSRALQGTEILSGDFEAAVATADAGDVVYLDPPYTVTHTRNGFLKYNAKVFSWDDQKRLARTAADLSARGCRVFVSNAPHETINKLYAAFSPITVTRVSRMAADSQRRREITEVVYTNGVEADR